MTTDKEAVAGRWDREVRKVALTTKSYWGLTLGDLRKVVTAAEGMGGDAEVSFEELRKHVALTDRWLARTIWVKEEVSDDH